MGLGMLSKAINFNPVAFEVTTKFSGVNLYFSSTGVIITLPERPDLYQFPLDL